MGSMRMKRIFIAIIMTAFPFLGAFADGIQYLILNAKNGTKTEFALAEEPKLSLANGEMTIVSRSRIFSISLADVEKYAFSEQSTSIANIIKEGNFKLDNGFIIFNGLTAGSKVSAYMQDGKLIKEIMSDDKGSAVLDMSILQKGVVIIKSNKTSIKIINR